ncbi:unnamed protein product, partial [Urochloa humidicola]
LISLSLLPPGGGGGSGDSGRSRVGGRRRLSAAWPPAAAGSMAHAVRPSAARGGWLRCWSSRQGARLGACVGGQERWWAGSSGDGWPFLPYFDLLLLRLSSMSVRPGVRARAWSPATAPSSLDLKVEAKRYKVFGDVTFQVEAKM